MKTPYVSLVVALCLTTAAGLVEAADSMSTGTMDHSMMMKMDMDKDGMLSKSEVKSDKDMMSKFDKMDANKDGKLDSTEMGAMDHGMSGGMDKGGMMEKDSMSKPAN